MVETRAQMNDGEMITVIPEVDLNLDFVIQSSKSVLRCLESATGVHNEGDIRRSRGSMLNALGKRYWCLNFMVEIYCTYLDIQFPFFSLFNF